MAQQVSLTDWERILMGDAPWIFLVELLGRSLVVYLLLSVLVRHALNRLGDRFLLGGRRG